MLYNVWNVGSLSREQLKYQGQTPLDIIENIVFYYTEPPQTNPHLQLSKIVDPMAGSGIVRDVCRKLLRRYMLFDINPIREDIPIEKNDILQGLPNKAKNTDLVYFDPPYFILLEKYPKNEFNKDYPTFLQAMKKALINIKKILKPCGYVALILKPMNKELFKGDWFDLTFDSMQIAKKLNYKLVKRIAAPLSTQQFKDFHITQAKEEKSMLNILRDIIILEK